LPSYRLRIASMSAEALVILPGSGAAFAGAGEGSGVGLLCPANEEHPLTIKAVKRTRNLVI